MRKYDLISSLFWLMCAVLIIIGSLRLPVGTIGNSGSGFFPLIIGCVLGVISTILFTCAFQKSLLDKKTFGVEKKKWYIIVTTILSLLIYTIALPRVGFLFTTFLLLVFLFKAIGELNWKVSLGGAFLTSFISYTLFKVMLKVELPAGLFGM